ncbi:MAG: hypothetical protein V4773_17880 [Verrucomicrobiota bacterium]
MPPSPLADPPAGKRFLIVFFCCVGFFLAAVFAFNVAIDPFRVFGSASRTGFNDRRPPTEGFDRMAKPYEILRVQPRTVIFGSSTAHSGFPHIGWWENSLPKPAYNYALLGANAREVSLSVQQAMREAPVEVAIVVADFFAYNSHYAAGAQFSPARLLAATRRTAVGFVPEDLGAFTLGVDTLRLSWQTLLASRKAAASPNTHASSAAPRAQPLFRFQEIERSYLPKWLPRPYHRYAFSDPAHGDRMVDYDDALTAASEKGARVIVIIPPIHARFQEAIAKAGVWSHYEAFKRTLVARTQAHLAKTKAASPPRVELWDFSLFNSRSQEAVQADSAVEMKWWIDSAHFTPDYGKDILDEILGAPTVSSLGARLVPGAADIEPHLAAIRSGLSNFRTAQPDVVANVHATLSSVPIATYRPAQRLAEIASP